MFMQAHTFKDTHSSQILDLINVLVQRPTSASVLFVFGWIETELGFSNHNLDLAGSGEDIAYP